MSLQIEPDSMQSYIQFDIDKPSLTPVRQSEDDRCKYKSEASLIYDQWPCIIQSVMINKKEDNNSSSLRINYLPYWLGPST